MLKHIKQQHFFVFIPKMTGAILTERTINDVSRTVCFKLRPAVPERATGEKPKVETTTTTTTTTEIIEE